MAKCAHNSISLQVTSSKQGYAQYGLVCNHCNKQIKFTKKLLKGLLNNGI